MCADLREAGVWTPILMLTAKAGDLDEAEALDTGADDYLTKPFSFPVLVARIRALLRRTIGGESRHRSIIGGVRVDSSGRRVWLDDREVSVTTREFEVLEFLVRRPGQVLSKSEILDGVWSDDFEGDPNIVEVYIGRLRRKLHDPDREQSVRSPPFAAPATGSRTPEMWRGIRARITALAVLVVVVVLVATAVALLATQRRLLTETLDETLVTQAGELARSLVERHATRLRSRRVGTTTRSSRSPPLNGEVIAATANFELATGTRSAAGSTTVDLRTARLLPDEPNFRILLETRRQVRHPRRRAHRRHRREHRRPASRRWLAAIPIVTVVLAAPDLVARRTHIATRRGDPRRGRRHHRHTASTGAFLNPPATTRSNGWP